MELTKETMVVDGAEIPLFTLAESMKAHERRYLVDVLQRARGNQCKAADMAGIHRNTIARLCDQHGIPRGFGRKFKARK